MQVRPFEAKKSIGYPSLFEFPWGSASAEVKAPVSHAPYKTSETPNKRGEDNKGIIEKKKAEEIKQGHSDPCPDAGRDQHRRWEREKQDFCRGDSGPVQFTRRMVRFDGRSTPVSLNARRRLPCVLSQRGGRFDETRSRVLAGQRRCIEPCRHLNVKLRTTPN
ncbi:hypothetical protein BS50DRAFT_407997 [Corynespora cassiicola Philippines]|uniref:Uncharacterized protein n=1 Tax=Corynespora cassiicola Philippines TaxID=1448308 RepID=A0A2T2NL42_CORCC|nr:hypothetical protein BS50DRAFT_407997 [Corynespora cassiicola Philippines]